MVCIEIHESNRHIDTQQHAFVELVILRNSKE